MKKLAGTSLSGTSTTRQRIPLNVTRQTLLQMDKLDNTNEFSNLLSDLEDK